MSTVITPELVKRYARSTLGHSIAFVVPSQDGLDAFIFDFDIDRAVLGMLAAAEMAHERATLAKCDRPERAVGHEMYALERSLVEAAGVDPIAWEKARGA